MGLAGTVRTLMATVLSALSVLVMQAVSISPASVPANGRQEALLTLDAPTALHLSVRSASGTSCEVIDRTWGPFAQAGTPGGANCELDLMLDAGQYKVRLESSRKGKGTATLVATAYSETNPTPVRLAPGSGLVTALKPGQQATFWLSLSSRQAPYLRVSGRHAGDVRLWRNGQWLEPPTLQHAQVSPMPGRPQHEWWLATAPEPGDYTLVAYGRDSTTVTGSSTDDSLTIEYGFRPGPPERSLPFTLGPSGLLTVQVPTGELAGLLSLETVPSAVVSLQALSDGLSVQSECRIEKGALVPECSTGLTTTDQALAVLAVRGPPGTRGVLEWAGWRAGPSPAHAGSFYGPSTTSYDFVVPSPGRFLVATQDLPADPDGAPLGCALVQEKVGDVAGRIVAHSALPIGDGEALERDFNFPDQGAVVWFDITSGGSLLQRAGLSSRRFRVSVSGKGGCELYRMTESGDLTRLTQAKPEGAECNELLALAPGTYQLQLQPALFGVRHLSISEDGSKSAAKVAQVGGCTLPVQTLNAGPHRLMLSRGAPTVRGLTLKPLPLTGAATHVTLDAKQALVLPVVGPLLIRAAAGASFGCTSQSGKAAALGSTCELERGADTVTLTNPGQAPVSVTLFAPGQLPPVSAPTSYTPSPKPLPRLTLDQPLWFDFARDQAQSVLFDVDTPGLYSATTLGLLATSCVLRTAVTQTFAQDQGGGRGRNCLLQTWLQKGRYLMTASTVGQSAGRAGLVLSRRPVRAFLGVTGEGEQYFRVEGNELVQQTLAVRAAGRYQLSTTAQGAGGLQCRLDDPEGWPLERVPTSCAGERTLRPGTWLWTQLPLTVESMRHTTLKKVRDEVVLAGATKSHAVDFFTWYRAELGTDGKDDFTFSLEGQTELDVVLTNGMQGRLYLLEKGQPPKAVEVIPPAQVEPPAEEAAMEQQEEQGSEYVESVDENYRGEEGEGGDEAAASPAVEVVSADTAPPPPAGARLKLAAGQYKLVTEHSRGDVGVAYRLHLGSATLLPGMTRTLPTPSRVPIFIPRDGTLRLRTTGDADVRCRLFDGSGKLVFEGSENGADWNCALAEPITKGSYVLVLEAETQQRGETTLSLALPAVEDQGLLTDGVKLTLGGPVVSWRVPPAAQDAVQEVSLTAQGRTPISCALENPSGVVTWRQTRVTACTVLVRPQTELWRVRAWTTDGSAPIAVSYRSRPVVDRAPGQAPADQAVRLQVARAGRFRTSPQVFCIAGSQRGRLSLCGPEASLEVGAVIFSAAGAKSQPLPFDEVTGTPSDAPVALALSRQPFLQNLIAPKPSLFLLEARVQHGERVAPSCAFDGAGAVRERRDDACFAASRMAPMATARLWAASEVEVSAQVVKRALVLPEKFEVLPTGRKHLTLSAGLGRFGLPKGARARLELTIAQGAWAVLLDDAGASLDLCAPAKDLRRCVLTGQGGSVAIVAGAQQDAQVTTVLLDGVPPAVAFTGLYEDSPRRPGTVVLMVPPAEGERVVTIEGALTCTVALSDGVRLSACRTKLPPGLGAQLSLEHGVAAVRAMVHPATRERSARLGLELPVVPGGGLLSAVAVPLQAGRIDRTLVVDHEAVVRVSADSGVCGLFRNGELLVVDGFDTGCELVRVLSPGTYRVLVRPFAGRVVPGTLRWTAEPVTQLAEGVGFEEWLAPGEARLFRFDTTNAGKAGLGVQARSELLECAVYTDTYQPVGEGCQQYLSLSTLR